MSRELDARVARVLFEREPGYCTLCESSECGETDCPSYSTTGDGMLAVVERMRELGWSCEVMVLSHVHVERPHGARFWCSKGPCEAHGNKESNWHGMKESVWDYTAPEAVCLAALRALEAGQPTLAGQAAEDGG